MRDGRVGLCGGTYNTVATVTDRHAIKFPLGAGRPFQRAALLLEERKTCLQVAFLMALLSKVLLRYSWQE